MSFLNIVGNWSGKGTLGASLHSSHLGHLVRKMKNLGVRHGLSSIFDSQAPPAPAPGVMYLLGKALAADSILRVEGSGCLFYAYC